MILVQQLTPKFSTADGVVTQMLAVPFAYINSFRLDAMHGVTALCLW